MNELDFPPRLNSLCKKVKYAIFNADMQRMKHFWPLLADLLVMALAYAAAKDAYSKDAAARKAARDGAAPKRAFMGGASGGAGGSERVRAIAERLAAVLEGEAALYRDAVDISAKKTDIIVRGKIEELDSLVKAEQIIILKIGKLEDERERIIGELSEELDVSLQGAALSDISSYVDEGSYARLNDCHKSLSHTLGDLRNTNEMNSQLLQNALDYVNFSVNLITSNQDAGNIYTQDGDDGGAGRRRRSVFDVKL